MNIEQDLWVDRQIVSDFDAAPNNKPRMSLADIEEVKAEILYSEEIQRLTKDGQIIIRQSHSEEERLESVFTGSEEIDRTEAEKMLLVYLASYGYNPENIKFKWVKTKHVAWSA